MSETASDPGLVLRGVFAGYGGGDILKGLTLGIRPGSLTCVVGPNGAGKSTLLSVLSGLLTPRAGEIHLNGDSLAGRSVREILRLGISLVPQNHSLFPLMTVQDNIELGGLTLGDKREVRRRREALQERFPLISERAGEKAGSLSGGQQKLVEIARALMLDPRVMLFDEPSAGLDPRTAAQVYGVIRDLRDSGRTILLVEQNVRTALKLADHAAVLDGGTVKLEGSGRELLEDTRIAALYLGGTVEGAAVGRSETVGAA